MKTLLLMQTGDMPELGGGISGGFAQLFLRMADYSAFKIKIARVSHGEEPGPASGYAGVIITGSPAMVTDREEWSEKSGRWVAGAVKSGVPVLGVCYGHQLMAQALGGEVAFHPGGMELGTHQVRLSGAAAGHPLLGGLPESFYANISHSQTVVSPPDCATVLGASAHDKHQILAYGERSLGLQFHPEFDAAVMQAYVNLRTGPGSPRAPMRLGLPVRETPLAAGILQRFINSCR